MKVAVLADHKVKLKETDKKDKYFDLARELKKLWNMNVTVILIVIGALSIVTKRLIRRVEDLEIRGRVGTIKNTALLRSDRILRGVPETCCHSNFIDRTSVNADVTNSQGVNNNNNNNTKP